MPITFKVADHAPRPHRHEKATSSESLLKGTSPRDVSASKQIIQSSISPSSFSNTHLISSDNGFVRAAFEAYSRHHHLTIRPEDIWFAILSQLNFYINANAEALRSYFVAHQGKKELKVAEVGSIHSVDFGALARRMTDLIQDNVKDRNLRDWLMPSFSTTTVDDRTTAAVLMMGTMQAYFSYKCYLMCGIPSVTLLGEREDYEDIMCRLDKLPELGAETKTFSKLLRPVLKRFVASFDETKEADTRDFWSKIAHRSGGGSGPSYLGGWLTAFCFWNAKGKCMYDLGREGDSWMDDEEVGLLLNGVEYHRVDTDDIPPGYASVPVLVDDNGTEYHTKMIAGSLGIKVSSSIASEGGDEAEGDGKLDSLQSLSGWMMYELKEKGDKDEEGGSEWYH